MILNDIPLSHTFPFLISFLIYNLYISYWIETLIHIVLISYTISSFPNFSLAKFFSFHPIVFKNTYFLKTYILCRFNPKLRERRFR